MNRSATKNNSFHFLIIFYLTLIGTARGVGESSKITKQKNETNLPVEIKNELTALNQIVQKPKGDRIADLFSWALKTQPNIRAKTFENFCDEQKIAEEKNTVERVKNCVLKCILNKAIRLSFHNAENIADLLTMLLMERKHLLAHLLHKELMGPEMKVSEMESLLEVILGSSDEEMTEVAKVYSEQKYGNLLEDIRKIGEKAQGKNSKGKNDTEEAKAVREILGDRLENLNKRAEIEDTIKKLGTICGHWKTLNDSSNERDEHLETDKDIEKMYGLAKKILVNFEPDTADSAKVASVWSEKCSVIINHVLADESSQKYFDELKRMLTIANLWADNSRLFYYQSKLQRALRKKNYAELSVLIATRANIDLHNIVSREFGICAIDGQKTVANGGTDRRQKNKEDDKHKNALSTTANLLNHLLEILEPNGYNGNSGVVKPQNLAILSTNQIAKIELFLTKPMNREQQKHIIEKVNKASGKAMKRWCEKLEKREKKMAKKGEKIEAEKNYSKNSLKKLMDADKMEEENFGNAEFFAKKICFIYNQKKHNGFTELLIAFMKPLSTNTEQLEAFNQTLTASSCKSCQILMKNIFDLKVFDEVRTMPLFIVCTKFISSEKLEAKDIVIMEEWYRDLQHILEQSQDAGADDQHHNQKKDSHLRRRKRVADPISITVIVVGGSLSYLTLSLFCLLLTGDAFFCAIWFLYLLAVFGG